MWSLAVLVALATPPDLSKGYFPGLARPNAPRIELGREGGPVILIVVDALRPDRMSPYGSARDTTPHLTALADEGVLFTNFYANGNWTRPSTASLMTGLLPTSHAVERDQDRLAEQYATLAELLTQVGVPSGAVVGNGNAGSAFGLGRGFSYFADTVKHWKGLPSAAQVVDLAVPFVREHRDEPFFLLLFFVDPHDPYHAPAPYEEMFVTDPSVPLVRSPHWELGRYSPAEVERMQAVYDGALRYTDSVIGGFFDHLKELGIYERSTIMVTADHGEAFGEHGVFLHAHHMYDEIIRVPMIVRAPVQSVRGVYNHYLFQTVDLMPTIVRSFGGRVPENLPGADIFRHLAKPELADPNRTVICEFYNFGISRRTIRNYTQKVIFAEPANEQEFLTTVRQPRLLPSVSFSEERVMMFDLAADPFERNDLYPGRATGPAWQGLLKTLRRHRDNRPRASVAHAPESIDPETRRDLQALGYIQ